ncbi:DedA family protein [Pseudonocardia adelaidensis]|uniref:Membrane-associated protein n=1 Tax=Pseudonocardia adelaidensis TaxID=648754 RepID=A0ABP9NKH9_9PSEU
MLTALLQAAAAWPAPVVLVVACAVLVVESGTLVGMALPGSSLLVALGLWSLGAPQLLVPAIAASALGTVAGAHLGWWRGRTHPHVTRLPGPVRRMAEPRAAQASAWLAQRRGPAAVLLLACGHWATAARPVMPRVAGAAGVPYRVAGPALVGSGTAWAATIVLLGNRVGALVLASAAWVPVALVALLVGALVLHPRGQRRRSPPGPRTPRGRRTTGPTTPPAPTGAAPGVRA